jgi:hypothetical protein
MVPAYRLEMDNGIDYWYRLHRLMIRLAHFRVAFYGTKRNGSPKMGWDKTVVGSITLL